MKEHNETNKIQHTHYKMEKPIPTNIIFSDNPGHFSLLTKERYKVDAYILLFDLTNLTSFTKLGEWLEKMEEYYGPRPMVILGNKSDIVDERVVERDEIIQFIEEVHLDWKLDMHFYPIKFLKASVLEDPKKNFDMMLSYLADQSYRALKKVESGNWHYHD